MLAGTVTNQDEEGRLFVVKAFDFLFDRVGVVEQHTGTRPPRQRDSETKRDSTRRWYRLPVYGKRTVMGSADAALGKALRGERRADDLLPKPYLGKGLLNCRRTGLTRDGAERRRTGPWDSSPYHGAPG